MNLLDYVVGKVNGHQFAPIILKSRLHRDASCVSSNVMK